MTSEIQNNTVLLGPEYIAVKRAWHTLEARIAKSVDDAVEVIDIDVASPRLGLPRLRFDTRDQVAYRLEVLKLAAIPDLESEPSDDNELLRAQVDSSLAMLQVIDAGNPPDIGQYIADTMGIRLNRISDGELDLQHDRVSRMFAELDGPKTLELGYSPQGFEHLKSLALTKEEFLSRFHRITRRSIKVLLEVLKSKDRPGYEVETPKVNEPWLFWADGNRARYRIRMNYHTRHDDRWTPGEEQRLGPHEGAHIVHSGSIRRGIDRGYLPNPIHGVTSVPGPEQWGLEGIADTIPLFVPRIYHSFDKFGRFFFELQLLTRMVTNNLHIDIMEGRKSDQELKNFYQTYLPRDTEQQAIAAINSRREGYKWPSYHAAYEDGARYHIALARRWENKPASREQFVRAVFEKLRTRSQILDLANSIPNGIEQAA